MLDQPAKTVTLADAVERVTYLVRCHNKYGDNIGDTDITEDEAKCLRNFRDGIYDGAVSVHAADWAAGTLQDVTKDVAAKLYLHYDAHANFLDMPSDTKAFLEHCGYLHIDERRDEEAEREDELAAENEAHIREELRSIRAL